MRRRLSDAFGAPGKRLATVGTSGGPRSRSWLIKRLSRLGVPPELLIDRYGSEAIVSIRRALLLAIGNYDPDQIAKASRELTIERCKTLCTRRTRRRSSSRTHNGCFVIGSYPLNQRRCQGNLTRSTIATGTRAAEGHTMVMIDAQDDVNVGHVFDIANKEVTIAQVRQWRPQKNFSPDYDPSDDCAGGLMTWY